jgi:GTP diphosphokinase / guanosine-3',5'-bis(diphosphate) 3'-diphosphatase
MPKTLITKTYTVDDINNIYDEKFIILKNQIKNYLHKPDIKLLDKAYQYAIEKHVSQVRKSGEPYFDHLFHVAEILTELKMDMTTLICGLLHDIIEDTPVTFEHIEKEFSREIAELINGVTKITNLSSKNQKVKQAENVRKMLLSTANDLRVIIIKFADRLHNMRTLNHMPPEKRTRIATETIDVYAPLAHRFGLYKIKSELEDLSLKYIDSDVYYFLKKKTEETKEQRNLYIDKTISPIKTGLDKASIPNEIYGRPKHFYSIYNKMNKRKKPYEEIYDLLAIRIVVDQIDKCYYTLGIIHSLYIPVVDRFKDYIATPKINGYQSLHTTIIGPEGKMVEIQIRTFEMEQNAEEGIAAHWRYKYAQNQTSEDKDQLEKHIKWLKQFISRKTEDDSVEFLDSLKIDLFSDEVFVYSPKGDLYTLPKGSTALDFAFVIHSKIGVTCAGAKVNGKLQPIKSKLNNGDVIEIITNKNQQPNSDWLHYVMSSKAKHYIRKWLKEKEKEQSILLGNDIFNGVLKKLHVKKDIINMEKFSDRYNFKTEDSFFAAIANGQISIESLNFRINRDYSTSNTKETDFIEKEIVEKNTGTFFGIDHLMVSYGKCCNPIPGDIIRGYVTNGRGITIHRNSCLNLSNLIEKNGSSRLIATNWGHLNKMEEYLVKLNFYGKDRKFLMRDLSTALSKSDILIKAVDIQTDSDDNAFGKLSIYVKNLKELTQIMNTVKNVQAIDVVERYENILEQ